MLFNGVRRSTVSILPFKGSAVTLTPYENRLCEQQQLYFLSSPPFQFDRFRFIRDHASFSPYIFRPFAIRQLDVVVEDQMNHDDLDLTACEEAPRACMLTVSPVQIFLTRCDVLELALIARLHTQLEKSKPIENFWILVYFRIHRDLGHRGRDGYPRGENGSVFHSRIFHDLSRKARGAEGAHALRFFDKRIQFLQFGHARLCHDTLWLCSHHGQHLLPQDT